MVLQNLAPMQKVLLLDCHAYRGRNLGFEILDAHVALHVERVALSPRPTHYQVVR
jgi:hypothetical protein